MNRLETIILSNLVSNEPFTRRVLPYIKAEYFGERSERVVFEAIHQFIETYNTIPSTEAIGIGLSHQSLNETQFAEAVEVVEGLSNTKANDEWLLAETEKFCRDAAVYNAIRQSLAIMQGEEKKLTKDSIPSLLQEALGVGINTRVGHDYLSEGQQRYDFYHRVEERIPFGLTMLNKITRGGLPKKTLSVWMAGVNVGKSIIMCDHAATCLAMGKNVLYITLEMAEERIAERIDANLFGVTVDDLETLPFDMYSQRLDKIRKATQGRLFIQEYPTAGAHVGHFRALLKELAIKKAFVPDIIFIDYLNICASQRFKFSDNSYALVKGVSEEIRGLAMEFNVPIVTATQLNRSGFLSSDVEMTDVAESWGLPATCDLLLGVMETEELEALGQFQVKQLKNRLAGKVANRRFILGVDKAKMKLFDVEEHAQPKQQVQAIKAAGQASSTMAKFFERDPKDDPPDKFAGIKVDDGEE